ncbi:MAG: type II secretion system F family protein, partial [Candidatus Brocadiae bacterium]|nr:type II secretion system F family protein [Candidatus Brocadiia bacterium]
LLAALFDLGGGPARMLMRKMAEVGLLWVACLGVMTIWRSFAALSAMRSVLHAVLLWVPVFGKLSRRLATARFADTLECLYAAGVPTPEALSRSAAACGNAAIGRRILDSVWLVREGGTITSALQASRALPSLLLNMVATGEEAGKLEESLHKVAEYEREDAGVVIERLAKVLPTIIVLAVIGLLAYMVLSAWGVVLRIPFAVN